jgi:hypothetical protein
MLRKMADTVHARMLENASLADHSLRDLRSIGHPYRRASPQNIHSPSYLVHTQSRSLIHAVRVEIVNQYRIRVGVDFSIAPHAAAVIFGTSEMVSRDFVTKSLEEARRELSIIGQDGVHEIVAHAFDLSR